MTPPACSASVSSPRFGNLSSLLCLVSGHIRECCLLACSQAMGLHCIGASVEVGNTVLTASEALLSALATLASISKQRKAASADDPVSQSVRKGPRPKSLTAVAFDNIVASLPDQVRHKAQTQQTFDVINSGSCQKNLEERKGSKLAPSAEVQSTVCLHERIKQNQAWTLVCQHVCSVLPQDFVTVCIQQLCVKVHQTCYGHISCCGMLHDLALSAVPDHAEDLYCCCFQLPGCMYALFRCKCQSHQSPSRLAAFKRVTKT